MVALLFTDVESSTDLWEAHPRGMREAHRLQRDIVGSAVTGDGGRVVKDTGDGVFAVFEDPGDALAAAVSAQLRLLGADWGEVGALRVRMGLHFGHAEPDSDGDLHGSAVHRAARVMEAGHGCQVVTSAAFASVVTLGDGVALSSLGPHRLKGIAEPIELFQVLHAELPSEFPPLRSLDGVPNNLPHSVSRFIGRDREMSSLCELLESERLVTIVGAGGAGKTRLALQVGGASLEAYGDGVWFVDLAGIGAGDLVAPTVAAALRISDQPGRSWLESITRFVADRQLLLLIDNCEHLLDAAASVVDAVLNASPGSRVMATSREPLNLAGERIWPIASLSVPAAEDDERVIRESESVSLFIDRAAAAAGPDFVPDTQELGSIVEICERLDGMPLAIELAAARVRALPVSEISARLDDRFRFLVGGNRTALARQRTLEATVAWSHQLLSDDEQRLFNHLSVFAGSFSLAAAEDVCANLGVDVLDGVVGLVDKSLLETVGSGSDVRYRMLETLRMFGRDRLIDAEAIIDARDRLVGWAVELAEAAGSRLNGPDQLDWLAVLDVEIDNLRAAMQWSLDRGDPGEGLAIAGSLHRYWFDRSAREGHSWLTRFLEECEGREAVSRSAQAQARMALGHMLQVRGENESALRESSAAAHEFAAEGDTLGHAWSLHYGARAQWGLGQLHDALGAHLVALDEFERTGDEVGEVLSGMFVAALHAALDEAPSGLDRLPALDRFAETIASPSLAAHVDEMAFMLYQSCGEMELCRFRLHRSLQRYRRMGQHPCVAHGLETASFHLFVVGENEAAALIHGAALALWDDAGIVVPPWERVYHEPVHGYLEQLWPEPERLALLARGAELGTEKAIDLGITLTSDR